jgi:hypothetical protein
LDPPKGLRKIHDVFFVYRPNRSCAEKIDTFPLYKNWAKFLPMHPIDGSGHGNAITGPNARIEVVQVVDIIMKEKPGIPQLMSLAGSIKHGHQQEEGGGM